MRDYDKVYFMATECQNLYYGDLPKMKLQPKRGMCLLNVPKKLPDFHEWLIAIGWRCFSRILTGEIAMGKGILC